MELTRQERKPRKVSVLKTEASWVKSWPVFKLTAPKKPIFWRVAAERTRGCSPLGAQVRIRLLAR